MPSTFSTESIFSALSAIWVARSLGSRQPLLPRSDTTRPKASFLGQCSRGTQRCRAARIATRRSAFACREAGGFERRRGNFRFESGIRRSKRKYREGLPRRGHQASAFFSQPSSLKSGIRPRSEWSCRRRPPVFVQVQGLIICFGANARHCRAREWERGDHVF
jgi:hypothetical protein